MSGSVSFDFSNVGSVFVQIRDVLGDVELRNYAVMQIILETLGVDGKHLNRTIDGSKLFLQFVEVVIASLKQKNYRFL